MKIIIGKKLLVEYTTQYSVVNILKNYLLENYSNIRSIIKIDNDKNFQLC